MSKSASVSFLRRRKSELDISKARGAFDFLWARDMLDWELAAVEAVPEGAAEAFYTVKRSKGQGRRKDIQVDPLAFVLRLRGHRWSLILKTLDWRSRFEDTHGEAKALSKVLKTKGAAFVSTDVSGSMYYEMFDRGKSIEKVEWEAEELARFVSPRPRPEIDSTREEDEDDLADEESPDYLDADAFFSHYGIYLPACNIYYDDLQLELEGVAEQDVENVFFLTLTPLSPPLRIL